MLEMFHVRRTQRAALFFATTRYGVREIAKLMGYSSWKIFSNEFRQYFKEHPTVWRSEFKRHFNKDNPPTYYQIDREVHLDGTGISRVNLTKRNVVTDFDRVQSWSLSDLNVYDGDGNLIASLESPTKPYKKGNQILDVSLSHPCCQVSAELYEGLEQLQITAKDSWDRVIHNVTWEATLNLELRRYQILL